MTDGDFLLKADEAELCELEKLWETAQLQTNWKLETCTKPDESTVTIDETRHESEAESEQLDLDSAPTDALTATDSRSPPPTPSIEQQ